MKEMICSGLALTIWHDGKTVYTRLEDPLSMTEVEDMDELNATSVKSREYHLREAVVIGMRRLIARAFEEKMMKVDLQKLPVAFARNKVPPIILFPFDEDFD